MPKVKSKKKTKKKTIKKPGVKPCVKSKDRGKDKGGRPALFRDPADLQTKIDEYFDSCWIDKVTEVTDKDGAITMSNCLYQNRPYTVAGLAHYLGFSSRSSLLNYDKNPIFGDLIKRAKLKIEMNIEEFLLTGKNAAGPIFWLKNHANYEDKVKTEFPDADGKPQQIGATLTNMDRAARLVYLLDRAAKAKAISDKKE